MFKILPIQSLFLRLSENCFRVYIKVFSFYSYIRQKGFLSLLVYIHISGNFRSVSLDSYHVFILISINFTFSIYQSPVIYYQLVI